MAEIKSFKALRYNTEIAGDINELVCPPYDIISEEERLAFIKKNSNNIIRLELPKGENAYKNAGLTLDEWMKKEILKKDDKAGIYVYEMEFSALGMAGRKVKGFVSLVKLHEFFDGVILPHEETLSKAKQDRFNLMSETFSNFSQIYSLYMDKDNKVFSLIDRASQGKADVEVTDKDGTIHRLWCVYDESIIKQVEAGMSDKKLYIADGHHRYETALNFHKYVVENGLEKQHPDSDHIMMMLVNMENEGLVVFPTHRIVHGLNGYKLENILTNCQKVYNIIEINNEQDVAKELSACYNINKKAFTLYAGMDKFYLMVLKDDNVVKTLLPDMSDAYCQLDVSILHTLVLERIFGIDKENMANQINLSYTRDIKEALEAVDTGKANCSFILNPTRVSEIRDVALANEKMPQKSTYFYPKLITGLVMNEF